MNDIDLALSTCKEVGISQFSITKCTSSYPAPINEANLIMISDLKKDMGCNWSFRSHARHYSPNSCC